MIPATHYRFFGLKPPDTTLRHAHSTPQQTHSLGAVFVNSIKARNYSCNNCNKEIVMSEFNIFGLVGDDQNAQKPKLRHGYFSDQGSDVLLFRPQAEKVALHYLKSLDIQGGYFNCNETKCLACQKLKRLQFGLYPVFYPDDWIIRVLRLRIPDEVENPKLALASLIAPHAKPDLLRTRILTFVKRAKDTYDLVGFRSHEPSTKETELLDDFEQKLDSKIIELKDAFPVVTNEDLARLQEFKDFAQGRRGRNVW